MLTIVVGIKNGYDHETEKFVSTDGIELTLEHSLATLSKWESFFEKPFLVEEQHTNDEIVAYIRTMILTPDVPDNIMDLFEREDYEKVQKYINASSTATWFNNAPKKPGTQVEVITSELIYYWMVSYNIPFETQHWHLNRLFTLIRVCDVKNNKPKSESTKMSAQERSELNRKRLEAFKTTG